MFTGPLKYLAPAAIVALTALSFWPAFNAGYVSWDDDEYVLKNQHIHHTSVSSLGELFDPALQVPDTYTPLTLVSFALEYAAVGPEPALYHRNNVLLHALNVLLVYLLILALTRSGLISLFVAALFGLHPTHVEAVAWIAARKDVLFAAFFLLSILAYLRYLRHRAGGGWLAASVLCFGLACLAKPVALMLPLCLWLIDLWEKRNFSLRLLADKLPYLAVAGITVWLAMSMKNDDLAAYTFADRFWSSCYAYASYLLNFLAPINLCVVHPFPANAGTEHTWLEYASIAPAAGMAALAFWGLKRHKFLLFGVGWFTITIAPTLHFVKVNSSVFYERFTYLPYIGLLLIVALAAERLVVSIKLPRQALTTVGGTIILLAAGSTYLRTQQWQNTETLWTDAIAKHPESYEGHTKRGIYFATQGKTEAAIRDLSKALELAPDNGYALNAMGMIHLNRKEYGRALEAFQAAAQQERNNADVWMNLGLAHMNLNQLDAAESAMQHSLELAPNTPLFQVNYGFLHQRRQDYQQAFAAFDQSIRLQPDFGIGYHYRGREYFYQNAWPAALNDFSRAIELNAQLPQSYYWRSRTLAEQGRFKEAQADALQAQALGYELDPEYLQFLQNGLR